jgi:hypothetical protein
MPGNIYHKTLKLPTYFVQIVKCLHKRCVYKSYTQAVLSCCKQTMFMIWEIASLAFQLWFIGNWCQFPRWSTNPQMISCTHFFMVKAFALIKCSWSFSM